jgi:hypothetical protein
VNGKKVGLMMNYWICCIFYFSNFGGEKGDEFFAGNEWDDEILIW